MGGLAPSSAPDGGTGGVTHLPASDSLPNVTVHASPAAFDWQASTASGGGPWWCRGGGRLPSAPPFHSPVVADCAWVWVCGSLVAVVPVHAASPIAAIDPKSTSITVFIS
jgi:hypothetical protein